MQLTFHPSKHGAIDNMEALSLAVLIVSFLVGRNPPRTSLPLCAGAAAQDCRRCSLWNVGRAGLDLGRTARRSMAGLILRDATGAWSGVLSAVVVLVHLVYLVRWFVPTNPRFSYPSIYAANRPRGFHMREESSPYPRPERPAQFTAMDWLTELHPRPD